MKVQLAAFPDVLYKGSTGAFASGDRFDAAATTFGFSDDDWCWGAGKWRWWCTKHVVFIPQICFCQTCHHISAK